MNYVVNGLFNDGVFMMYSIERLLSQGGFKHAQEDCIKFVNRLKVEDFIIYIDDTYYNDNFYKNRISLSDNGQKILNEHRSYLRYLNSLNKKRRWENID